MECKREIFVLYRSSIKQNKMTFERKKAFVLYATMKLRFLESNSKHFFEKKVRKQEKMLK